MVKVDENLSYNNNYYPEQNTREYITIHETANTGQGANADAHANFINNGSQETWHYTVDDKHAIKHFLHTTSCWHAGTSDPNHDGNYVSIGIEMCVNSDGDYVKTLKNTIELVKQIQKEENIPDNKVVQHNFWSGKNCPTLLREGTHGMNWNEFLQGVKGNSTSQPKNKKVGIWTINEYGTYYRPIKKRFKVGSEPIITRKGSPFRSVESAGEVQPNQEFDTYMACIQDGHYWLETDEQGFSEFIPICEVTGEVPNQKYGTIWGEYV